MSFTIGPTIGRSALVSGNQPLRGTWRRSASATAAEIASGSLADTSLEQLYTKLDERLGGAWLVRGSAPTYTEDTVTIDLVTVAASRLPSGLTVSQIALKADDLVSGLPLVNLNGRTRTASETQRAGERDVAAEAGQTAAETQSVSHWLAGLGSTAKLLLAAVVIVVVIGGAVYFLPRPTGAKKSA